MEQIEELKAEIKALRVAIQKLIDLKPLYSKTYLNTEETAFLLGVQPRTVRKYNQCGKLEGKQYTERGKIFFPLVDVLKFQETNLINSAFFGG